MWDVAYRDCTTLSQEESSDESGMAEGRVAPTKHRLGAEPWRAGLVIDGCKDAPVELGGNPGDQCKLCVTVLHGGLLHRTWSRL